MFPPLILLIVPNMTLMAHILAIDPHTSTIGRSLFGLRSSKHRLPATARVVMESAIPSKKQVLPIKLSSAYALAARGGAADSPKAVENAAVAAEGRYMPYCASMATDRAFSIILPILASLISDEPRDIDEFSYIDVKFD